MSARLITALIILDCIACTSGPPNLTATVTADPDVATAAAVAVAAIPASATSVSAEFGDTQDYGSHSAVITVSAGASSASISLYGLSAPGTTHVRVSAFAGTTLVAQSADVTVTTVSTPVDFPDCHTVSGTTGAGVIFLSLANPNNTLAMALIVDQTGRPLWYRSMGVATLRGYDFQRNANGHYTAFDGGTFSFNEFDLSGPVLHNWADASAPLGADGHDLNELANGNAVVIGRDSHVEDTTPFGGGPGAVVLDARIDEIDPTGKSVFQWNSHTANIGLDEVTDPPPLPLDGNDVDAPHANSLALTPDGNALISFYYTSSLMKIDLTSGAIVWRMGGNKSDFPFPLAMANDPLGGFDHQHNTHYLPNGNLLMFDNGLGHDPPQSRAAEYQVDETNKTLKLVWEYRRPRTISPAGGSATRLDSGDTIIGWPGAGIVSDIGQDGTVKWEMECDWNRIYRALPADSL